MTPDFQFFHNRGGFRIEEPTEPGWYWMIVKTSVGRLKLVPAEVLFPPRKKRPRIKTCHDPHCRQSRHLVGHTSSSRDFVAWGPKIEEPTLDREAIIAHLQKEAAPDFRFVPNPETPTRKILRLDPPAPRLQTRARRRVDEAQTQK